MANEKQIMMILNKMNNKGVEQPDKGQTKEAKCYQDNKYFCF